MIGTIRKKLGIRELEKRLMLDASLGALVSTTVFAENTVNASPQILDTDVSVTGTTTDFDGESLTISTTGGAEDQISIHNEGSGASQIGFDGTNVSYGGTIIGTVSSDGTNGADLVIDFDADATKISIERLIENITYQNNSDNPTTSRTLNFSLGALFSENMTVTVVGQNEGPSVDTNTGLTVNEGSTTVITSAQLGVSDPDNADGDVTFTVDADVTNGRLELSSNAGVAISSFTLADLNGGLVRYVHDGGETVSDSFDFTVSDGSLDSSDTFSITVTPEDDAPTIDTNTGTSVFQGLETTIGADEVPALFGSEVLRQSATGSFAAFNGIINNNNSQISVIFTTPGSTPTGTPGEVIYETGGSGRGISLVLADSGELEWRMGPAQANARLSSGVALTANTQYAVVMEIDRDNGEVRMHYQAAGDFNWFEFGRTAEVSTAWSDWNLSGSNASGLGVMNSSLGGYTGSLTGTTFQGTIDSDLVITRFPSGGTTFINTKLVSSDVDTPDGSLLYTITTNVQDGTLYNNGVAIGLNDTFTQDDLDNGLITYTHGGAADPSDSFIFSLSDGTNTLTNQTYTITVDTTNTAPTLPDQVLQVSEDAANNDTVGTLGATDPDVGQTLTYSIQGGTGAGIFTIDAATGEITVLDNSALDYESTTSYTLDIRVTDDGPSPLFANRTFIIDILDVNENLDPVFPAQGPFSIGEDGASNDLVGTVAATDPEAGTISYSIVGGNTGSVFKIGGATGEIRLNNISTLDFETRSSYTLTIRATDDNAIPGYTDRNVTINITDANEGPSFNVQDVIYYLDQTIQYNADNGNFYKYYNNNVNFATAFDAADDVALNGAYGHMVTITSNTENNFVDSIIGSHIWLAASDAGTEGQWVWLAGPEAGLQFSQGGAAVNGLYEKWNGAEPNNGSGYNYVYMNTNSQWYDQTGNESRRYVIEWEGGDVINNDTYVVNHANADASDIANGTSIGFVQAGDPDADSIAYSITGGNADGIFEVDTATGEVRILDNTNLDALIQDTYVLTVRATESGGGLFDEVDITINFNNSLSLTTNNGLTVDEAATTAITAADLNVTDADTPATDIIFTITAQPAEGQVELTTSPGAQINSFTLDDIQNNRVVYVHSGSETIADNFEFSVTDGASTSVGNSFNIIVTPQNDAPGITVNTGTTILEGASRTITNAMLNSTDLDDAATDLTYTASGINNGHIEVNSVIQNTFTQDDIDNNRVVFVHDGSENDGSFNISLADGGEDGSVPDTDTFTLTRTPVNDSPVVTVNNGTTVTEGATIAIGNADLDAVDPDDSDPTLVYTLSVIVNGQVELSTNPNVPIISFTQDDLDNNRVVFRHDGSENLGGFNFSVADGGEDGAPPATGSFAINVDPVNDSPLITTSNNTTVDAGNFVLIKKAILNATDPDDSGVGLIYTVDSTTNGQLELLGNPGIAINSFTQADINNSQLVFRHDGTATLTAQFQVTLADGGEDSATTDSATIDFTVNNTNDSPTITLNAGVTVNEGSAVTITTSELDSFDPDDSGTGLTWTISNVSANGYVQLSTNAGVAINSFTQADLDNGLVQFVHDGSETISASFDLELADGGENSATTGTATFNVTVTPVNEGPSITVLNGTNVSEGGNVTITNAMLNASDIDDTPAGLTYTASNYANGHIEVNSFIQNTFTQDDINNNLVVFVHDGSETSAASFDVSLADGGENGTLPDTGTFNLSVSAVNDSPVIGTNTGATMNEGAALTITNAMLNEGDPDDAGTGLTYTASNYTNGHIEVSGVVQNTFTQTDINNGIVVFIHDSSETVASSFDISLADDGEDASVAATGTFNITVTPVNDAPTWVLNTGTTVLEGGQRVLDGTMLSATDVDNADGSLIYTITSIVGGTLENTNTVMALGVNDTFLQSDLDNGFIRYTHDGSEGLTENISVRVGDGALSAGLQNFTLNVTPVNDTPSNIWISKQQLYDTDMIGSSVAVFGTIDPDVPGDAFTYTLLDDAGGMFSLVGNNLVLMTSLEAEIGNSHDIIIQTDDGNGGIINRTFTLNVEEFIEPITGNAFFIAPEQKHKGRHIAGENIFGRQPEDIFTVRQITNPDAFFNSNAYIHAALNGNAFEQAFYGEGFHHLEEDGPAEGPGSAFITQASEFTSGEQQQGNDLEQEGDKNTPPERFTNIREVLQHLQTLNDEQQQEAGGEETGLNDLEQYFEDVLTYQEARKNKLREALTGA